MRNPLPIPFTTVNYLIGLRPPNHRYIPLVIYNRQLLHRTASSKTDTSSYLQPSITSSDCVLQNTDTSSYLQPSITSSDCVLLQAADIGTLGTFTFASIIPSCSFTFASIIQSRSFTFAGIIPSCSFTFASIIPSCFFTFTSVIPTLFSFFLLKLLSLLVPVTFLITISLNSLAVFYASFYFIFTTL